MVKKNNAAVVKVLGNGSIYHLKMQHGSTISFSRQNFVILILILEVKDALKGGVYVMT